MSTQAAKNAIVLLSGGLDSATCAAVAKSEGYRLYALTFDYGQRHASELDAARQVAAHLGVEKHVIARIDLRVFGGSALTDDLPVPKDRPLAEMDSGIPITYVPARNTIFLSYALAWAEVLPAYDIFIGVNAVDYSGYPDCRPEFIRAYQAMALQATRAGVEQGRAITIRTPIIDLDKGAIIRRGLALQLDYGLTLTCYDPIDGLACGRCDSCRLRLKGFADNQLEDPVRYHRNLAPVRPGTPGS